MQTIVNLGTAGDVLNGQNGSTTSADSNDALFLDWDGGNYVYLPGVASNFLMVPDEAALDITGDIDIRFYLNPDDWTPVSGQVLLRKFFGAGGNSYLFFLQSTGTLYCGLVSGGTILNHTSTASVPFVNGEAGWVRFTADVNDGAGNRVIKFFTSVDGVSWKQLGTTLTIAGAITIDSTNSNVFIGDSYPMGWKLYRAQIFNGIDGTKVLDVDTSQITSGSATSFTALTGQTVTINRSTSGRKTVAVVSPVWLFGTDDYMQVADNDLIDFGATDSFTVVAVVRQWHTQSFKPLVFKLDALASIYAGWGLYSNSTIVGTFIADGTNSVAQTSAYSTATSTTIVGVRNVASDNVVTYVNGLASASSTDTTTGTLSNSLPLRIGRNSVGAVYSDMEVVAVSVFRRALSATEIANITTYYQARWS